MIKIKIYDRKVKPKFKNLNINVDKYDGNPDPEEMMEKQDEFDYKMGIENADILKRSYTSSDDKRKIKWALCIIIALVISYFPLKNTFDEIQSGEISKIQQAESINKIFQKGIVTSFERNGDKTYAIIESDGGTYHSLVEKELQRQINVGDEVEFEIEDTIIPNINIKKVVKK